MKMAKFSHSHHTKHVFFETERVKAQVMGLEPGQQIPPCRMNNDVIFVVLEGKGKIIINGEEEDIKKSSCILVPKEKESRSLKAKTKMVVLAIQVKSSS
ncbi:MAG: hypothetical protein DRJ06_05180 [Candidatus Aminicenantes bacterium]|nr:MAG: hypothetical protein DRJ06_05180 [Candidatus Aminicenantes bacterium]HDJ22290.1 hypothetical protein [Candidatus Aminicenantes bacterium]